MEDSAIIALYHDRNEQAIAQKAQKYGRYCHRIALNLLGIREDAQECVNDTWLAAWDRMPPERPQALRAFLGRLVRNLSITRYRAAHAQKRYAGLEVMLSELEECIPAPDTVERTLESQALAELLSDWLEGLDGEDRALFLRRYWYGDAVQALAKKCGQSPNWVAQRLRRLRQKLRFTLEAEGVAL